MKIKMISIIFTDKCYLYLRNKLALFLYNLRQFCLSKIITCFVSGFSRNDSLRVCFTGCLSMHFEWNISICFSVQGGNEWCVGIKDSGNGWNGNCDGSAGDWNE